MPSHPIFGYPAIAKVLEIRFQDNLEKDPFDDPLQNSNN